MLQEGARVGPYEIVGIIGTGGMGQVYRARDPRLQREVAIKMLGGGNERAGALRRFESEARAASSLNHPNVVAVYDVGVHEGEPYIVTELLEGKTLRELQNGQPLPLRTAVDLGRQLAKGAAAAHGRGLVHRDLKPENVFVTRDMQLKILDFGIAKLAPEGEQSGTLGEEDDGSWLKAGKAETAAGAIIGTIGYMSPEQVKGHPADQRSDVFAIGAVLHEMITGHRLFNRPTRAEVGWAIVHDEAPDLEPLAPAELSRIVRRCLEKEPRDRFESARDLAFALDGPVSAEIGRLPAAQSRLPVLLRRLRWPLVAAVLGAGVAGAVVSLRDETPTYRRLTFHSGRVSAARFGADGTTFAFSAAWQGKPDATFISRFGDTAPFPFKEFAGATLFAVSPKDELLLGQRPRFGPMGLVLTLSRTLSDGEAPRQLAESVTEADWGPDGEKVALARVLADGTDLEYPVGRVLWHSGKTLDSPRVSPAGDKVAVMQWSQAATTQSIWVADAEGQRKVVDKFADEGFAWSPSGKEIWFARDGQLRAADLAGKERVLAQFPGKVLLMDVSKNGRLLLARADARIELTASSLSGPETVTDYSWFDRTGLVDLSSDGRMVLFEERNQLFLREAGSNLPTRLGEVKSWRGLGPGKDPDVLAVDGTSLVLISKREGGARKIPLGGLTPLNAQFLPDGQRLVVTVTDAGGAARLYRATREGNPVRISDEIVSPQSWVVAPAGDSVVAVLAGGQLVTIPVAGGPVRPLPQVARDAQPVGFLQDGKLLLVAQGVVPPPLYKLDLDTGESAFWRPVGPRDLSGVFRFYHFIASRDGTQIAYDYYRERSDLYLVEGLH